MVDFHIPGYDPHKDAGDCYYDADAAENAVQFFTRYLQHVKGEWAGKPFELAAWQAGPTRALFGWKRQDGTRRYRKMLVYVPRKNGKSTWVVGIGLYVYFCDKEPGMECYLAAQDIKQAGKIWSIMLGMVNREPQLHKRCRHYKSSKKLTRGDAEENTFDVVSPDGGQIHGSSVHLGIVDELHTQSKADYIEGLESGAGARRQPLVIYMTTADYERPSVCNEEVDYARKVRDGIVSDPTYLPVIYEGEQDDDWQDPEVWAKCNPGYPVSPKRDFLQSECRKAGQRPHYQNTFKRLYLNIQTKQNTLWLDPGTWHELARDFDPPEGAACYAAFDLASTTDICALTLLFTDDGNYYRHLFWVPQETADDRIEYLPWITDGSMMVTPGRTADYRHIRQEINRLSKLYHIKQIGYDPWNATHLVKELVEEDGLPLVQFRQGFQSMSAAAKEYERRIIDGDLRHDGNPVQRWMVANAAIKEDPNGNIKPVKPERNSVRKVDGVVTDVMATGLAMVGAEEKVVEPKILLL